jgi:hypothetical protein
MTIRSTLDSYRGRVVKLSIAVGKKGQGGLHTIEGVDDDSVTFKPLSGPAHADSQIAVDDGVPFVYSLSRVVSIVPMRHTGTLPSGRGFAAGRKQVEFTTEAFIALDQPVVPTPGSSGGGLMVGFMTEI